jgi:protein involved in polysaccharide export with SLBB domain
MTAYTGKQALRMVMAAALVVSVGSCTEMNQYAKNLGDYLNLRNGLLNPAEVGRFDKAQPWGWSKPVQWPILDKLELIDEPDTRWTTATDPLPSDLVVETKEYVVGEGDILNISIYELVTPGMPYADQKQVNELGMVTLTNLGQVKVAGLTPSEIEQKLADLAVEKHFLLPKSATSQGPQVSVQLYQSRARVFNILGQVTAPGTYNIIGTNFRILDALALGRDIAGGNAPGMDYMYVIRTPREAGVIPASQPASAPTTAPANTNPLNTIEGGAKPGAAAPTAKEATAVASDMPVLLRPLPQVVTLAEVPQAPILAQAGLDAAISNGAAPASAPAPASVPPLPPTPTTAATAPAPTGPSAAPATGPIDLGQAIGGPASSKPIMVLINGKWVEAAPGQGNMTPAEAQAAASGMTMPRVIRIPINKVKEGVPGYNIVIQSGDTIVVPNIEPGEFYLAGHVNRPGVYSLTGRKVTLKQAVAAAGGLDALAIPRRCDLIRRVGNVEVTVQVDLQRIFDGEQPDIYLKSNDLVNVGTDMVAPFLAVTRNAYRASYGWGFTYDRNFWNQPVINSTR